MVEGALLVAATAVHELLPQLRFAAISILPIAICVDFIRAFDESAFTLVAALRHCVWQFTRCAGEEGGPLGLRQLRLTTEAGGPGGARTTVMAAAVNQAQLCEHLVGTCSLGA